MIEHYPFSLREKKRGEIFVIWLFENSTLTVFFISLSKLLLVDQLYRHLQNPPLDKLD